MHLVSLATGSKRQEVQRQTVTQQVQGWLGYETSSARKQAERLTKLHKALSLKNLSDKKSHYS